MKILFLFSVLIFSHPSIACDKPYRMQVGAYFDSSSVVTFWSEFAQEIAIKTKCPTNIHPAASYEQQILDSINNNGDIFIVPTYYTFVFHKYGLETIIETDSHTKTYLVTQKQFNPKNLATLKTIQISTRYSDPYLLMKQRLSDQGLMDSVTFKFGGSFQANAMSVIRGTMDAAIIYSPAFDPLPEVIKQKVNYIAISESKDSGSIMVRSDAPQSLKDAILHAKDKIKLLKWIKSPKDKQPTMMSHLFQEQVTELINKTNKQINKPLLID